MNATFLKSFTFLLFSCSLYCSEGIWWEWGRPLPWQSGNTARTRGLGPSRWFELRQWTQEWWWRHRPWRRGRYVFRNLKTSWNSLETSTNWFLFRPMSWPGHESCLVRSIPVCENYLLFLCSISDLSRCKACKPAGLSLLSFLVVFNAAVCGWGFIVYSSISPQPSIPVWPISWVDVNTAQWGIPRLLM